MPMPDFRSSSSWQSAIELGPVLMELAEAMPATEELGLSWQLRQCMVEIPAAIAIEQATDSEPRLMPVIKLIAALELIDKVYPALDTAAARAAADKLGERIMAGTEELSSSSGKGSGLPRIAVPDGPHPPGALRGPDAATSPIQPSGASGPGDGEHPAPASVPVLEEPSSGPSVSVPVQQNHEPASEDPNVHPSSGQ